MQHQTSQRERREVKGRTASFWGKGRGEGEGLRKVRKTFAMPLPLSSSRSYVTPLRRITTRNISPARTRTSSKEGHPREQLLRNHEKLGKVAFMLPPSLPLFPSHAGMLVSPQQHVTQRRATCQFHFISQATTTPIRSFERLSVDLDVVGPSSEVLPHPDDDDLSPPL